MADPVVRFEIGAAEDQPLVAFDGEPFGWRLEAIADGDTPVDTRGGAGIDAFRDPAGNVFGVYHRGPH